MAFTLSVVFVSDTLTLFLSITLTTLHHQQNSSVHQLSHATRSLLPGMQTTAPCISQCLTHTYSAEPCSLNHRLVQ